MLIPVKTVTGGSSSVAVSRMVDSQMKGNNRIATYSVSIGLCVFTRFRIDRVVPNIILAGGFIQISMTQSIDVHLVC